MLLAHCGDLIAAKQFDQALDIISGRERSFWLDRDVGRKAQWEACRRMAELGRLDIRQRIEHVRFVPKPEIGFVALHDVWVRR